MAQVFKFTLSPFYENTYIITDETKECIVIDPGCYTDDERKRLKSFVEKNELKVVRLINTHCHLDHIFGNRFIAETYNVGVECHEGELPVLRAAPMVAQMYGVRMEASPDPVAFISEGDEVRFGNTILKAIFTPGHSPASLCFFCEKDRFLIAGDTLFKLSIGRTDLPGGDYDTLMDSIHNKIFPLGDDVKVYAGHEAETTIGFEKIHNPFVGQNAR